MLSVRILEDMSLQNLIVASLLATIAFQTPVTLGDLPNGVCNAAGTVCEIHVRIFCFKTLLCKKNARIDGVFVGFKLDSRAAKRGGCIKMQIKLLVQ